MTLRGERRAIGSLRARWASPRQRQTIRKGGTQSHGSSTVLSRNALRPDGSPGYRTEWSTRSFAACRHWLLMKTLWLFKLLGPTNPSTRCGIRKRSGCPSRHLQKIPRRLTALDLTEFAMFRRLMDSSLTQAALRFLEKEDGPTAVEYAVMLALIIVVCI